MTRLATCAVALVLATAASGCLDFTDDEGPVMSIELFWDEQPDAADFSGGTCRSAGVRKMQWSLVRNGEKTPAAEGDEPCANGIDVLDPAPGDYELHITGRDDEGNRVWGATCVGLSVLRFDDGYECDVCDLAHGEACSDAE